MTGDKRKSSKQLTFDDLTPVQKNVVLSKMDQSWSLNDQPVSYFSIIFSNLPHTKNEKLSMTKSFKQNDITGEITFYSKEKIGLPFGSIPRIFFLDVATQIKKTKSNAISLGLNASAYMRSLGYKSTKGRNLKLFTEQLEKCAHLVMSVSSQDDKKFNVSATNLFKGGVWWGSSKGKKAVLYANDDLVNLFLKSPLPVETEKIQELTKSPLAIDLYIFLTMRNFSLFHNKNTSAYRISLKSMIRDIGNYNEASYYVFKTKLTAALLKIKAFWHELNIKIEGDYLILSQSPLLIKTKEIRQIE